MIFANTANPLRTPSYRKQVGKVRHITVGDDKYIELCRMDSIDLYLGQNVFNSSARAHTYTAVL